MSIEKYKLKLETAIYENCDKYYIGGKIVEQVLKEYHNEQLNLPLVSGSADIKINIQVAILKKVIDKLMITFDNENDRNDYILDICNEYKREAKKHYR